MPKGNPRGNPDKLKEAAEAKKEDALEKTEKAIVELTKAGQPISFPTVAKAAGVSVSYLYKYDEIKERIAHLREQQKRTIRKSSTLHTQPASDKSKGVIIHTLKEDNKKLRAEIEGLRRHIEVIQGRACELERVGEENTRLKRQMDDIRRELEECRSRHPAEPPSDNPKVTPIDKGKTRGITDRIKDELDRLGIKLNSTLTRKIKAADEETVLNALAALEEAMGSGNVRNVSGFLVQAITEGWTKEDSPRPLPQRQPEIYTASPEPDEELVPPDQLKKLFGGLDE